MEMEKPRITCEETDGGQFARFVVEPLEKGYGITLGNCMRRTLLSSLPGSAVIAFRIAGVAHEFSTIRGVAEDVVDIVLNLKGLAVKCTNQEKDFITYLKIRKNTPGEVTAKDFESNDQVEILNPDLHICTMDEGAVFDLDVMIGNGRGYVTSDANKTKYDNIDFIAVDSIFSPVKKVNFNVDATRVGQSIDYDKLTLEVTTNGTTSAREIVSLAGKIINEHVGLFIELLVELERNYIDPEVFRRADFYAIPDALEYLERNYMKNVDIARLSAYFNMSRRNFFRNFRRNVGINRQILCINVNF